MWYNNATFRFPLSCKILTEQRQRWTQSAPSLLWLCFSFLICLILSTPFIPALTSHKWQQITTIYSIRCLKTIYCMQIVSCNMSLLHSCKPLFSHVELWTNAAIVIITPVSVVFVFSHVGTHNYFILSFTDHLQEGRAPTHYFVFSLHFWVRICCNVWIDICYLCSPCANMLVTTWVVL